MKSYQDKLLDPRWQRKRLQILARDNFTCQQCFDARSTLHVHHTIYKPDTDPWDYPDEDYTTLCENCHQNSLTENDKKRDREFFEDIAEELLSKPYTKEASLLLDKLIEKYNV
jgi:5-methylcytosine-specific restriction endonuclease McrA